MTGAEARAAASAVPVAVGARFPRVSTRGAYDRSTGEPVAGWGGRGGPLPYRLYPKSYFDGLAGSPELAVMIHGLRNTASDATRKFTIAKARLRELGYGHPVVGYSYDSNTVGAGAASPRERARAAAVGVRIAEQNGPRLAAFVRSVRSASPAMRVRLLGHSLGSQVILSALGDLAGGGGGGGRTAPGGPPVESVHLFGASIPASAPSRGSAHAAALAAAVRSSISCYYAPTDEVLLEAAAWEGGGGEEEAKAGGGREAKAGAGRREAPRPGDPLGLRGVHGRAVRGYRQFEVRPESHRFASYAAVLDAFP